MRRKDREVTDINKVKEIMDACDVCRIGFKEENGVYILPLNFGYTIADNQISLYFHGAEEGKKITLAEESPYVGFEMDTKHRLITDSEPCDHSFLYQSIIGKGRLEILEDDEEKRKGLNAVMKQYTDSDSWEFPENMLQKTAVMKISVEEWTCKEH